MNRVLIVGSVGYDLTIRLARLPRAGETLLGGELLEGPGGKGANQALAARRAGAAVTFVTAFGGNAYGRLARENLEQAGIDLRYAVTCGDAPNQLAIIFVGEDGANMIGVAPGASLELDRAAVEALPADLFEPANVLLANLEVPIDAVHAALQRARDRGMRTILNPAPVVDRDAVLALLPLVDILTPNESEAEALVGQAVSDPDFAGRASEDLMRAGARSVIVTLGERGCWVNDAGVGARVRAPQVRAVDTVGAGDAFNGALAMALADGKSLIEAAQWGCVAGSIAVTKPGAQAALPTREKIEAVFAQFYRSGREAQ